MKLRQLGWRVFTGLVVAASAFWATPPAGAAAPRTVLQIGQSTPIPLTGGITPPAVADPRLNVYDYDAQVPAATCDATTDTTGGRDWTAPPGGQLCIFSVFLHAEDQVFLAAASQPTVSFEYGSGAALRKVTLTPTLQGASTAVGGGWAVAVPAGAPARLVLTSTVGPKHAVFSQAMNLRTRTRIPPDLPALYRARTAASLVAPQSTISAEMSGSWRGKPLRFKLSLAEVALSLFAPEGVPTEVGYDQAYLIVAPKVDWEQNPGLQDLWPPPSGMVLRLPDGHTVKAAGVTDLENPTGEGWYYFKVPATFTTATLVVTPGPKTPADDGHGVGNPSDFTPRADTTAQVTGQTSFPISLPDQTPLHLGATKPTSPANPAGAAASSGGVGALPWILTPLVAIAAAAVGVVGWRRSRGVWVPAAPVTTSQLSLLAPTPGELLRGRVAGGLPRPPAQLAPSPTPPGEQPDQEPVEEPTREAEDTGLPTLAVRVLGPLEVEGLVGSIRRSALRRLLVALALADRPVGVEELRDLMATDPDRPVPADQVHSYASKLRAVLPPGTLPPIGAGAVGYQLAGTVEVDTKVFDQLATRADLSEGAERIELATRALRLVRGTPLAHGSWEGIEPHLRHLETRIENLAADTARACLAQRDARTAEWAVAQGLLAAPGAPVLWELRLLAAAAGSGVGLTRAWEQTQAALDGDAQALSTTYDRLRTGQY